MAGKVMLIVCLLIGVVCWTQAAPNQPSSYRDLWSHREIKSAGDFGGPSGGARGNSRAVVDPYSMDILRAYLEQVGRRR